MIKMTLQSLERLPNKLFESFMQNLDLASICNLRLVNRELAHNVTPRTFISFFLAMRVILSRDSLESFVRATSSLGTHVEHLTIVGVIYELQALEDTIKHGQRETPDKEPDLVPRPVIDIDC
jgi:hypothetical protein